MARVTNLSLRNVRCFAGEQSGHLARITLLVGPNSVGKSTFLACYKTLSSLANFHDLEDTNYFDQEPFLMGGFDTIARTGCESFSIGGIITDHFHNNINFDFKRAVNGNPQEWHVHIGWMDNHIEISFDDSQTNMIHFKNPRFNFTLNRSHISYTQISSWLSRAVRRGYLPFNGDVSTFKRQKHSSKTENEVVEFSKFINFFRSDMPLAAEPAFNVCAINPTIGYRQRIYHNKPRIIGGGEPEAMTFLADLGKRLGLWKNVQVKKNRQGYAIKVGTGNGTHDLIDVGYGVHSMLPLARAFYEQPDHSVFLLQQPEVHLHPEAQVNLAQYMVENKQGFFIETHSDHFVDRFRICVMRGQLAPEDLSILYFEPLNGGSRTDIHSISIDEDGNLLNTPKGYRDFFTRETHALLGFKD